MAQEQTTILNIEVKYSDGIKAIAEYRKQIDDLKAAEKELKKQLKDGTITQQEYNEAMADSKIKTSQLNEASRAIQKQLQNQIRIQQEQEGSLKQLRAELANLTNAYDKLSETQRKGEEGKKLKDSINAITDALKEGEEETQRYQRNVGNYKQSIIEALGLNGQLYDTLTNIAGEEANVSGFFANLKSSVTAFGSALKGLITNPIFLAVAGIAGTGVAFKWWYDYNKGMQDATRLTSQFTGLAGDELKSYRNEILAVSEAFNVDFRETLMAANSLAQQFGISANEALQLIQEGFVSGADANGQFIDTLKEYPAYFNEAGISADQFIAIIAQTNKMGIFSDKGVDAIKEANIRIREMTDATAAALDGIGISSQKVQESLQNGSKTTFDVMKEVSEKLSELPDSASEVGKAISNIFGGPGEDAGLKYIRTLKDISTNLDEVKDQAGVYAELQEEQLRSQIELENALSGLFDMTGGNFETLTTMAKVFVNEGLTSVIKGVISLANYFIDLYNESIAFRSVWSGIVGIFKSSLDTVGNLFGALIDIVKAFGTTMKGAFTLDFDMIKKGFADYAVSFKNLMDQQVKDIKENYSEAIEDINSKAKKIEIPTFTAGSSTGITQTNSVQTRKKELEAVKKAQEELYNAINKSTKEQQDKSEEESEKELQREIENRARIISARLEAVKEGTEQEYQLRLQQLDVSREKELADTEITEELKLAITEKYEYQRQQLITEREEEIRKKQQEETQLRMENEIMQLQQSGATELEILQEQAEQKLELLNSIQQGEEESEQEFLNRKLQANQEYTEAKKALADKEIQIEQEKYEAAAKITSSLSGLFDVLGNSSKEFAILSKTIALAEIAINQGKAIAAGIAQSQSVPFPANLGAIATTIAAILSGITQAISTVKSAKFATGGLVTGSGSGTSDSIPAQLSNGESVITAKATQMFAPILSTLNQAGGGVPINVAETSSSTIGEDMLASSFAKGLENMPAPVVTVEEINRVSNRVKVVENLGTV